jgi:uncharacterized protein YegL
MRLFGKRKHRALMLTTDFCRNVASAPDEHFDVENPTPRTPLIFNVDESCSMVGPPIDEVRHGLHELVAQVAQDPEASRTVELALVSFGMGVVVRHGFSPPQLFQPPYLEAHGYTPLAEAGLVSAEMVEERLTLYQQAEVDLRLRPHVFFLTDGCPTSSPEIIERFTREVARHEQGGIASYHALYTKDADPSQLAQIFVRPPRPLDNFLQAFEAISQSVTYASQNFVEPDFDLTQNLQSGNGGARPDVSRLWQGR